MKTFLKIFIVVVLLSTLAFCGLRKDHSSASLAYAPRITDARLLNIAGTRNFRDLGGYNTVDGRTVKSGMIYRADNLAHLGDAGQADLAALNLKTITDLRSDEERKQEPDDIAQSTLLAYNVLPINDQPVDIRKLSRKIIMGRVDEGEVMALLDHRRFITSPAHRESWGGWLKSLVDDANTPHLFHCTSGKDRTGYGAAILLLTLGVDKETVMSDFLFSNDVLAGYNDATIARIEKKVGQRDSLQTIRKIMGVSRETMEATFAEMESGYGSVDGFVEQGLGIDATMRTALQDKFLE
jgi:protein-tyrosine phosphatase